MNKIHTKKNGGLALIFSVILLSVFGVVMVHSASYYVAEADYGNSYYFTIKQALGVALGIVGIIFTYNFDYRRLKKLSVWLYVISVVLLVLVFVPLFSVEIYGAKRWIKLAFFTVQPSEIAKFAYIIFTATYFSNKPDRIKTMKGILPVVLCGLLVCGLIILEPNMSITMCVALLMLSLMFCAGVKIKHLLFLIVPVIIAVPVLILIEPYRLLRLSAFLNPWASPKGEGYQLIQSLYALGLGGWFGVGLFSSRQKYKFLPFAESDFILSIIGEELGFVGVTILFALFFLVIYLGFRIASRCKNLYGYILSSGITLIFSIQVIINALVVTGSIPPTGLPLPLISAGNTSLIVYMMAFGIVGNIAKDNDLLLTKKL